MLDERIKTVFFRSRYALGIMKRGEYYWRGVGPAFKVIRITPVERDAELQATTSITGFTLTANTAHIPAGWVGPLTKEQVARIEAEQTQQAAAYREAERRRVAAYASQLRHI